MEMAGKELALRFATTYTKRAHNLGNWLNYEGIAVQN